MLEVLGGLIMFGGMSFFILVFTMPIWIWFLPKDTNINSNSVEQQVYRANMEAYKTQMYDNRNPNGYNGKK